jgi:hypothetical protein
MKARPSTDSKADRNANLEAVTAQALQADKKAAVAKDKARRAKAKLKSAKQALKLAKTDFKAAKKHAKKAAKLAARAQTELQANLDKVAKLRKKAQRRAGKSKKEVAVTAAVKDVGTAGKSSHRQA